MNLPDSRGVIHTGFNVGPGTRDFMRDVQRTLIQQPDFTGIGGHGVEDSRAHGRHSQVSIGLDGLSADFRQSEPDQ